MKTIKSYVYLGYYIGNQNYQKYSVYSTIEDLSKRTNAINSFKTLGEASDYIEDIK